MRNEREGIPSRPAPKGKVEQTPMHARDDEAADIEGKDIVQIGSEGSFPASDPPSWMNVVQPGRCDPPAEEDSPAAQQPPRPEKGEGPGR